MPPGPTARNVPKRMPSWRTACVFQPRPVHRQRPQGQRLRPAPVQGTGRPVQDARRSASTTRRPGSAPSLGLGWWASRGTFYATARRRWRSRPDGLRHARLRPLFGKAVLAYLEPAAERRTCRLRVGLEAAAGVPDRGFDRFRGELLLEGAGIARRDWPPTPSAIRARSSWLRFPRLVEPQLAQVMRGALEPPRRPQVSDPILAPLGQGQLGYPRDRGTAAQLLQPDDPSSRQVPISEAMPRSPIPPAVPRPKKQMAAAWYLADSMGEVLAANPDLHQRPGFPPLFPRPGSRTH